MRTEYESYKYWRMQMIIVVRKYRKTGEGNEQVNIFILGISQAFVTIKKCSVFFWSFSTIFEAN